MTMRSLFLVPLLAASLAASAGPQEDYAAGDAAYRRGDVRGAIGSLRKAADAGHVRAQVVLGTIYDAAEQDEDAVRYLAMAAERGDPEGATLLAGLYEAGEGVARDPAKARQLLEKAAGAGYRDATFLIAAAYLNGGLGLAAAERASPAALDWIRKAADGGHLPSVDRLAVAYRKGDFGLAADARKAQEWEARARAIRGAGVGRTPARGRLPAKAAGGA